MATYLTPRQAAEQLGISARQVRRLCASGELPALRLGRDWRIAVSAVLAYELAHTSQPAAETAAASSAKRQEEVRPATSVDGFTLPEGYEPVFPHLWGRE